MDSRKAKDQHGSGYKFLGGWIPEEHPATLALVWQMTAHSKTSYLAEIRRNDHPSTTLKAATLQALAQQLTETCGMARRSMVRLGIPLPAAAAK